VQGILGGLAICIGGMFFFSAMLFAYGPILIFVSPIGMQIIGGSILIAASIWGSWTLRSKRVFLWSNTIAIFSLLIILIPFAWFVYSNLARKSEIKATFFTPSQTRFVCRDEERVVLVNTDSYVQDDPDVNNVEVYIWNDHGANTSWALGHAYEKTMQFSPLANYTYTWEKIPETVPGDVVADLDKCLNSDSKTFNQVYKQIPAHVISIKSSSVVKLPTIAESENVCHQTALDQRSQLETFYESAHNGIIFDSNPSYHFNSKDATCYYVLIGRDTKTGEISEKELSGQSSKDEVAVMQCGKAGATTHCFDFTNTSPANPNPEQVPDNGIFEKKANQYFEGQYKP
jgi:hypothetical protein